MKIDVISNKKVGVFELKNAKIMNIEEREENINVNIHMKKEKKVKCPYCKSKKIYKHSNYTQKVKDLKMLGKETFLVITKKRYKCTECKRGFLERVPFISEHQRMTNRLYDEILKSLESESSYTKVGKELGVSTNTVIRVFDTLEYPSMDLKDVKAMGIDEFKGDTGGERYNCIITDVDKKVILDILPKRTYPYIVEVMKEKEEREKVEYVISDMWKPYKKMFDEFFKRAKFVVDKYHWVRQVVWAFEEIRKGEQKKFTSIFRKHFKKSKSLLIKRNKYLNEKQKKEVDMMLGKNDKIQEAYNKKEEFMQILDYNRRIKNSNTNKEIIKDMKGKAVNLLSEWILRVEESEIKPFKRCAKTMQNWEEGILNSIEHQYSNGFTEGCNNKIKVLKRNGYGYRNFRRFRNRILHMFKYKRELIEASLE